MTRTHRLAAGATAAVLLTATGLSACSDNGSATATTTAASSAPAGAADPNAPEVNPAGDIPDNQAFVAYTPPGGSYSVKVPEGWARTDGAGVITFTDKLNSVRMESAAVPTAPTVESARATEVPEITALAKNYEPGKVDSVPRPAGDVVLITYRADSAPDPVTGKIIHLDVERYEFYRDGTEVILTLSGPQGADNVDPWKIVTDSFSWQ